MLLKISILEKVKQNRALTKALEDLHNKSYWTIQRWIDINDPALCRYDSIHLISAYLRIPIEDLYEQSASEKLINNKAPPRS